MELRESIVIHAPVARVWEAFRDFAALGEWNPFLRRMEGTIAVGERPRVAERMFGLDMPLRPTLTVVEPPHLLRWRVTLGSPALYTVERSFIFDPLGDDRTHAVQSTDGSGVLAPLITAALFVPVLRGYRRSNAALKERVEVAGG